MKSEFEKFFLYFKSNHIILKSTEDLNQSKQLTEAHKIQA